MAEHAEDTRTPKEDARYWTELEMEYEKAFGDDAGLRQAVERYLDPLPLNSQILECGSGQAGPLQRW